jgi:uncharacterized membrane protein YfcA
MKRLAETPASPYDGRWFLQHELLLLAFYLLNISGTMVNILWFSLILLAIWFSVIFIRDLSRHRREWAGANWVKSGLIGFVVNFFDVLGIGAFAPQTALLRFTRLVPDRVMPGTLNVANTLPVLIQAIIFIRVIEVEPITLVAMLASAAIGAIFGARYVSRLSENMIRLVMGIALLVTAGFMILNGMQGIRGSGTDIGLHGSRLLIAVAVNAILGALMTAGIGLYAPCMALVFLLGLSPKVAFPIMMGSCAFLMPPASATFIGKGAYDRKAAVGMAIPGMVAVLIAAFIVKSLPLDALRVLVVLVIIYTAASMLIAYARGRGETKELAS